MKKQTVPFFRSSVLCAMPFLYLWGTGAIAAATDLANAPLANGVVTEVKPNVAMIIDDSGSMEDQNMPDSENTNKSKKCWGWYKYNTLFYNPTYTYKPPYKVGGDVYSDGVTRFPDAVFNAALKDGYFSNPGYTYTGGANTNGTVNLTNTTNLTTSAATKYYYTYPSNAGDINSTSCLADSKYASITSANGIQAPGVTTGSDAAKTNYANWYSYYRNRAYTMKAAASEAFKNVSDAYRIGLLFINSPQSGADTASPNDDLLIDDFTGAHRTTWFTRLQEARGSSSILYTPLRGSLSRVGQIFAGKVSGWDPVQYSCQQNFSILSTDGYWNTNSENSSYGPKQIDGSTDVGNVDGGTVDPVPAKATVTIGNSSGFNPCYRVDSVLVNSGATNVELLASAVPSSGCETSRGDLGSGLASSINNKTGTTGFSATWSSPTLTISAPPALGNLTVTPSLTVVHVSGGTRTFTAGAFSGYVAGSTGAPVPFKDALNKSNTLADIAYYYYTTDLRTTALGNCSNTIGGTSYTDLCTNNVLGAGKDVNNQQHMTTFTMGLGASGTVLYESNYETASKDSNSQTTQYVDILQGTPWPDPIGNSGEERIDDLWHAAVNGRGTYYSASNPASVAAGLSSALGAIKTRKGSASAAATSNLQLTPGDNWVFQALYRTIKWDGELIAYTIDTNTGGLSEDPVWTAQGLLDNKVSSAGAGNDARTIKFFSASGTNNLKDFTFTALTAEGKDTHFSDFCSKTPTPDQCGNDAGDLNATQKTLANSGENLVKYLRGQGTYEDENSNANPLYRARDHILGDIVDAQPVYLKKDPFFYELYDTTYGTFKLTTVERAATVFAASNDGMLHAFDAENGNERWAYVPSFVMPNMWKLADKNYSNNHQFYVDGSPTVATVCSSSTATGCAAATDWKTILIGGLNKGGCGYYALDVTDPTTPKGLWEFSHPQLGYSYGNPVVTRRKDGKWVVIFSSGYNNTPGGGCPSSTGASDGNGHVFILDALTGKNPDDGSDDPIDIPTYTTGTTKAGDTTTPSGLAKLNVWVDNADLNIASRIYGGDLLGNLWRIDFDDNYGPAGREAMLFAQLVTAGNLPQPITIQPELNDVKSNGTLYHVVTVATGKYLGVSDRTDTSQNTVYAFKDDLTGSGIADVRGSDMVQRTLAESSSNGQTIRTVTGGAIDWASKDGWYFDLNPGNATPGERVNTDMQLFFNALTLASNVPDSNACNAGGIGLIYFVDLNTGLHLPTSANGVFGFRLSGNALVAGITTVRVNGKNVTIVIDTAGGISTVPEPGPSGGVKLWRSTWREIPY